MTSPIHVWQPPLLQSAVGKRVAVSTVTGPEEVAEPIRRKMLAFAPSDVGRAIGAVDPQKIPSTETIRLVSAVGEVNDIALASVARQENIDFVLRGQVMTRNQLPDSPFDPNAPLAISWRLMSMAGDRHVDGLPVVVDLRSSQLTYPDLALATDPMDALTTAAVRDTYRLITPSIVRDEVELAVPRLLPGSKQVRRGNTMAHAGRWADATKVWQETLDRYPTQTAALHNLAIAAAAGQDFSKAKELARRAIRRNPISLHKQTLVWIEQKQRLYHEAFDLPDPPEGWFVTHDPAEPDRSLQRKSFDR